MKILKITQKYGFFTDFDLLICQRVFVEWQGSRYAKCFKFLELFNKCWKKGLAHPQHTHNTLGYPSGYIKYLEIPWNIMGYFFEVPRWSSWTPWDTLGYLRIPWNTTGYLRGHLGVPRSPWHTPGYLGIPWNFFDWKVDFNSYGMVPGSQQCLWQFKEKNQDRRHRKKWILNALSKKIEKILRNSILDVWKFLQIFDVWNFCKNMSKKT